jgi:hypothetical protein
VISRSSEAVGRPTAGPLRRWGGLAAGVLVLGFLGWALVDGWATVSEYDWDIEPAVMALGVIVVGLFYLASGVGYGAIVDRLHAGGPPARTTLSIWARSLLGRYVPGKFLMIVSRVVMSYDRGVPRRVTVAATVYEQLLTLGVAAGGSVLFVILFGTAGAVQVWLLALLPLLLLLLHPRIFGPASAWLLRKARREPLPVLLTPGPLAALIAWYALTAFLLCAGVWLLVRSAAGPEAGSPAYVGLAFLVSFAISVLAFLFPSGIGVREGAFAIALAHNVPTGVAVALSVGTRLVMTLVELAFIAVVVLVDRHRR